MALVSTSLPALLLELSEQVTAKEATLNPVQDRISISYDREGGSVTIDASFPAQVSVVNGKMQLTATNYTADTTLDLDGSLISDSGATTYAAALMVTAIQLSNTENIKQAAGGTLPNGVGTLFTFTSQGDLFGFSATLPLVASQNNLGQTVLATTNYLV